jgi:hypothetical protein
MADLAADRRYLYIRTLLCYTHSGVLIAIPWMYVSWSAGISPTGVVLKIMAQNHYSFLTRGGEKLGTCTTHFWCRGEPGWQFFLNKYQLIKRTGYNWHPTQESTRPPVVGRCIVGRCEWWDTHYLRMDGITQFHKWGEGSTKLSVVQCTCI